ncbi:MAG: hypothetical protein NNA23_08340 [Nitrospira sp.]|nr:hypothetical protein [Nitrospira sp.]
MPDGLQQYVNLENRLVLLAWLNSLLGYRSNGELLENCKTVGEGFGADGHSFLYHHLIARRRGRLRARQRLDVVEPVGRGRDPQEHH